MLPNRLIAGWCLGVLALSAGSAGAKSAGLGPTDVPRAGSPAFEAAAAILQPVSPVPTGTRVAQRASDRNNVPASLPNSAHLSLQMTPETSVRVGTKISFRVTTKKPGFLLLVDIDASGNMSQIFPSPEMIVQSPDAATNLVKPGEELLIPNEVARKRGFEYVMTPPTGAAAVVAILSDRRVQIIDLPEHAPKPRSTAEIISDLASWTRELRVPDADTGKLQAITWSFDIKPYAISE